MANSDGEAKTASEVHVNASVEQESGIDSFSGNSDDRHAMMRMGKSQELRRNFRLLSIFGFSMVLQASWEAIYGVAVIGLLNGGTAGLIWMYLICWIGFGFVNLSMAEMGSMAPTSGGQYHWTSEFAPRKYQKFLSYLMGWLCVLGWQASTAGTAFVAGTMMQGLIVLGSPDYVPEKWHGTLLTIAIATFGVVFNTLLAKKLPLMESIILAIHIFAFFGILVTLWVLSPTVDATTVFTTFSDGGSWGSLGFSTLVGMNAGVLPLLGADAAVHLSEEIRDAGRSLPLSMMLTTAINGAMGWVMTITFCFCITDLDQILASPTGYPYLQTFLNATSSPSSAIAMGIWVTLMTAFSSVTGLATASRQLYAFGRDQGLPFSKWFATVSPGWDLPLNAIVFTFIFSALISLINIGSAIALNAITGLMSSALLSSYICSIGCMVWRRVTNQQLLPCKFSLGKWGLTVNIISMIFLIIGFIFSFFPTAPNPTADTFNWNVAIYFGVVLLSLVHFAVSGRHKYAGPVEYVRKLD